MGGDWSRYSARFAGPRIGPAPVEPVVAGVDGDRVLPSSQSIYQGEYARFLLVFDPIDFVCNENDFTTSSEDVTVTMEEGADNVVRVTLSDEMTPGYATAIYFRDQLIMFVTAVARKVAPDFIWEAEWSVSNSCVVEGFNLPIPDDTTIFVVKMRGQTYDVDLEFTWDAIEDRLECDKSLLPSEMTQDVYIYVEADRASFVVWGEDDAAEDYTLTLLSITHNGATIYP